MVVMCTTTSIANVFQDTAYLRYNTKNSTIWSCNSKKPTLWRYNTKNLTILRYNTKKPVSPDFLTKAAFIPNIHTWKQRQGFKLLP